MSAYTANVRTPDLLNARIDLSVLADGRPFDLTGAAVTLEIWDTRSDDELLYSASDSDLVITVADTVVVDIPADTAVYEDLDAQYSYRYGLTIVHPALSFRVQGIWQKVQSYGPGQDTSTQWQISSTDESITIMTGGVGPQGVQGDKGDVGAPGSVAMLVTSVSGDHNITPVNQTVVVIAGIDSVNITAPSPADMYDAVNDISQTINVTRPDDDDQLGTVLFFGNGPGLPGNIWPGETYTIQSDGNELVVMGPY